MLSLSVMECPNCHFENKSPATECLKCGIVFAKYGHKQQAVEAPATVSEENLPSTSTREEERQELRFRILTLPLVLIAARIAVGSAPGVVRLLTMWVHETGHAVTAWLCGYWAVPSPWVTPVSEERNWAIAVLMTGGLAFVGYRFGKIQRWGVVAGCVAAFVVQVNCMRLFSDQARTLIVFGGDGGCFVLGSLLMATFYMNRQSAIYQNSLRWGFVVIGALAFMDAYVIWTGSILNIPFGETENGVTDPSVLTETYGWPIGLLINRYVRLANTCLAGLTVTYIAGIAASMARGLSARKPA
jgi:hypothetical protein